MKRKRKIRKVEKTKGILKKIIEKKNK